MRSPPVVVPAAVLVVGVGLVACSDPAPDARTPPSTLTVTATSAAAPTGAALAPPGEGGSGAAPPSSAGAWTAATPAPPGARTSSTASAAPRKAPTSARKTPTTTRRAPLTTRQTPAPSRPAPTRTARGPTVAGVRVPAMVGRSLTAAYAALEDLGVQHQRRSAHDASGKGRTVLNPNNWQVCSQVPGPGSMAGAGTVYEFGVVKYGERCR
jgi:hypothetical protein